MPLAGELPLNEETSKAKKEAHIAIYKAIATSAAELEKHPGSAAEGLKHLAEAYAWLSSPGQSH